MSRAACASHSSRRRWHQFSRSPTTVPNGERELARAVLKHRAIPDTLWTEAQALVGRGFDIARDVERLFVAAEKDGRITEDELRFIASLSIHSGETVQALNTHSVAPDRLEVEVPLKALDRLRTLALSRYGGSEIEIKMKRHTGVVRLMHALNDPCRKSEDLARVLSFEGRVSAERLGLSGVYLLWKSGLVSRTGGVSERLGYLLASDPVTRGSLNLLLTYITTPGVDLRIEVVWQKARHFAIHMGAPDATRVALSAMAVIASEDHMGKHLARVSQGDLIYQAILAAGKKLQRAPESQVFAQGVIPENPAIATIGQSVRDFTADHNRHFFPHAYLTYELRSRGWGEKRASAASSLAGVAYELLGGGIAENDGNEAIHDALKNAYGAAWGNALHKNPNTPLPGPWEGPPISDRQRPNSEAPKTLSKIVSGFTLLWSALKNL